MRLPRDEIEDSLLILPYNPKKNSAIGTAGLSLTLQAGIDEIERPWLFEDDAAAEATEATMRTFGGELTIASAIGMPTYSEVNAHLGGVYSAASETPQRGDIILSQCTNYMVLGEDTAGLDFGSIDGTSSSITNAYPIRVIFSVGAVGYVAILLSYLLEDPS